MELNRLLVQLVVFFETPKDKSMPTRSDLVYRSAVWSLTAQLVIGSVTAIGLVFPVNSDLKTVLLIDVIAQLVEFVWYAWFVLYTRRIVTRARYIDWFVSTPIMLFSISMFFLYRRGKNDIFQEALEQWTVWMSISFNWLMLSFGLLAEVLRTDLDRFVMLVLGTSSFAVSFAFLSLQASFDDAVSTVFFSSMLFLWALYGVAAIFPERLKNISYNALDVFSKNVFGLAVFIYAMIE